MRVALPLGSRSPPEAVGKVGGAVPARLPVSLQSDPEFAQWKKELTETFTEAQRLLRRAPKFLNRPRASLVELSKPPLCHRSSNGL